MESMHVALSRNETHQNFNIWVYGERGRLVRGSGLFVGDGRCSRSPLSHSERRKFIPLYRRPLQARSVGTPSRRQKALAALFPAIRVTREKAVALEERNAGLYFDWGPDSSRYLTHVENRSPSPDETHVGKEPSPKELDEFIDALVRSRQ